MVLAHPTMTAPLQNRPPDSIRALLARKTRAKRATLVRVLSATSGSMASDGKRRMDLSEYMGLAISMVACLLVACKIMAK